MTRGVLRRAFKASFFVFLYFALLPSRSIGAVFARVHSQRFIAQPIFDALILAVDQSVSGGMCFLRSSHRFDDYFCAGRRKHRVESPSLGASTLSSGSTNSQINRTIPVRLNFANDVTSYKY